ncbi:acyclic terpene utilization AtuA family protein [Candidatus Blastococcus massiliensis]|uniref:acyclic terpene utilization AtuA family protein n=1 Tax=Candidatus Blastococcus massiliensis TaxID=1470358 RepID=UPI0004B0C496|nr:acyclic terpene utilization AtuA family protein [Candidatus Blastococcus massiliensis]
MREPLRIANCSGFYGDRLSAAREMVEGGPIDVLTGDWLAELTMLILARTRASRPGGGYARTFVKQMEHVMGTCLDRGIKVVANAGGLDPDGCAEAVAEVAGRLGLSPTIAYVSGDDLLPRLDELVAAGVDLAHLDTGEPLGDPSRFISANAYLGCWGIVDALNSGADIVITGRTTDAAIVCGPAAWHHGWARDDWDALAGAAVAGHVIECGTQATGGNYSFFTEVPGMARTGFPWAEIAADGSSVIGKHDGTGGQVSVGTVTSQLLYEIGGPAYLGPDVTARFDTVALEETGPDRVRISGAKGEPPPPTLKVAMNSLGGFRTDLGVALVGLDVEAKAALVDEAFWAACPYEPADFADVTTTVVRTDKEDPATNEEAVAVWRLTLKDPDEKKLGRSVSAAMTELALATIPGFFGVGGGGRDARPYGVYRPSLVPAELVPQQVTLLGGPTTVVASTAPTAPAAPIEPLPGPSVPVPTGETERVPLGHVVGARSGDKGGNANLGVFTRSDVEWAWLDDFLTVERLAELLPEIADLRVDRYRLPALRALNFVVHGLLGEGVAASTRQDGQAKSLGEWLRARHADIPVGILWTTT